MKPGVRQRIAINTDGKTIGDFEKRLKDMGFFRSQKILRQLLGG